MGNGGLVRPGNDECGEWYPECAWGKKSYHTSPPCKEDLAAFHTYSSALPRVGGERTYIFSQTSASPPSHLQSAKNGMQDEKQT